MLNLVIEENLEKYRKVKDTEKNLIFLLPRAKAINIVAYLFLLLCNFLCKTVFEFLYLCC